MMNEPDRVVDASAPPVLVTGAAGKTGLAMTRALAARGASVRALVRRDGQLALATEAGASQALVADLTDAEGLAAAMRGARAVYFICPNMRADEAELGRLAIGAAVAAGVGHFVYHSVLHPQAERMPHHWQKLRVEEALFESGLEWTILQPTAYMQNMLGERTWIVERGEFRVPYPVVSRLALVDLDDVAVAAALITTESGHRGAIYELVGCPAVSQVDVARQLSAGLGRLVRAIEVPRAETRADLEARGLSDYEVNGLMRMFSYYAEFGLEGGPRVLEWLLGRPPATLAEFVRRDFLDA